MTTEEFRNALRRSCIDVRPDVKGVDDQKPLDGLEAVVTKTSQLWPNGATLDYCFLRGQFQGTPIQQQKVGDIIKEWEQYCDLKFQLVQNQRATIRITFNPDDGSWSYIGNVAKQIPTGEATMNLGWVEEGAEIVDEDRGVILHEFGHTLGLNHEHQSPARGGKLQLKEAEIIRVFGGPPNNWPPDVVRQQVLNVYNKRDLSNYSEVDIDSIMMYSMAAAFNVEGIEIPRHHLLSPIDKAYMIINYPRAEASVNTPEWTFEHALEVAKVDPKTTATLVQLWRSRDTKKLRTAFNTWNAIMQSTALHSSEAESPSDTLNTLSLLSEITSNVLERSQS